VEEGIEKETGRDLIRIKEPRIDHSPDFELEVFSEKFDFILAQSIFSHAAKPQISACLRSVREVLRTEGVFLATFKIGQKDYEGKEWVYPGCVRYTHRYIQGISREHGLVAKRVSWPHPNGQTWYAFGHRSRERALKKTLGKLNRRAGRRPGSLYGRVRSLVGRARRKLRTKLHPR